MERTGQLVATDGRCAGPHGDDTHGSDLVLHSYSHSRENQLALCVIHDQVPNDPAEPLKTHATHCPQSSN